MIESWVGGQRKALGMGRGPHIPRTEINMLAKTKNKEGISVFLPLPAPHSGQGPVGGEPGRSAERAFLLLALHPALGPPFRILGPLFLKNNFYWSVVDLQRRVSFRCTAKRSSYTHICVCSVARSCPTLLKPHEL